MTNVIAWIERRRRPAAGDSPRGRLEVREQLTGLPARGELSDAELAAAVVGHP